MPNILDATGLTVDTVTEIVDAITLSMQDIYGADINVDQNSPDGQLINIFAQSSADNLQVLVDVFNSFTVEKAYGTLLDQRVAINGLTRQAGTYTYTNITVTVNQALTLTGLDALNDDPNAQVFTVADAAGNQFYLAATHIFSVPGSTSLSFRAKDIGLVETTPNTITNQVTTVLGVTSVNNPAVATSVGVNEETDAQLKVRHGNSFALASTGPADAVEAALAAIPDVTDAFVVENDTNGTVNTVGAHSIWCIVTGGTDAEIAQAIYAKKGIGCGMKGSSSYTVTRPNGTGFTALWDASIAQPLYIEFTIQGRVSGTAFDADAIAAALAVALVYKLGQAPTIGDVITAMLTISPNAYLTAVGVSSNDSDFFDVVQPDTAQHYYTVAAADVHVNT